MKRYEIPALRRRGNQGRADSQSGPVVAHPLDASAAQPIEGGAQLLLIEAKQIQKIRCRELMTIEAAEVRFGPLHERPPQPPIPRRKGAVHFNRGAGGRGARGGGGGRVSYSGAGRV